MNTQPANNFSALKDPNETTCYTLCLVLGSLLAGLLIISVVGIAYGIFFLIYFSIFHLVLVGHIRGSGVQVGPQQFPRIHQIVERTVKRLEMAEMPEVYVMQAGGALNAFATRFVSRKFVVLYSDLVEACTSDKELEMIVGHELAHLKLGHLNWTRYFTMLAIFIPFLYQAYSRSRERSCDAFGFFACQDLAAARSALLILAVGKSLSRDVNLSVYREQAKNVETETLMTISKLFSMYPFLTKRITRLEQLQTVVSGASQTL